MLGAIKDRFQRVKNNITGTGEKTKHHPSPSVPSPSPGPVPRQQQQVFPQRRSSLSAASAAAHLAHASTHNPVVASSTPDHGGHEELHDHVAPLTRPRPRAPGVHQPPARPYSAVFPSASNNPSPTQYHTALPPRPVSMTLDPSQLATAAADHPDQIGQGLANLYAQPGAQPVPPTQQARVVYRVVQRPGHQPEIKPAVADANGHPHPIPPSTGPNGTRPLPLTPSPLAQAATALAQNQKQQQQQEQQQQQQRTIADTRARSTSQSSLRVPIHMRHPKPAVSVAASSARNSTASTASTATAGRPQVQPQARTLQKKRSSTALAMAKLQANAAPGTAAPRRVRRKPVGSVRSVHPDIEFDSQQAPSNQHHLVQGQVQSEYFESVQGDSAGNTTPGIVSSHVSDEDEDDGDEQWELAPDQTIPRSPSPTLHHQQGGNRSHQVPHPHSQHNNQHPSPYMLHHPQFHAHLHGGGASPAASNRTSVASSQYGAPGTPSMSVVTTDVSSLNSSVLANASALGNARRPSSGISERPAHFRHSNLTDYSSIRSTQASELGGPGGRSASGLAGSKSASEPVMQVTPTSTHVKFDSSRGRLSGCLVFTVRVAGVPAVAEMPKPQALLGSSRDPTIIVEGKAEPTTNTWAWMGGSSTGSVRSNNGGSVRRRAQAAHKQVGSLRGGAPNLHAVPVRSSLRGANPNYFLGSVRSMRSVTFALEAEAERELQQQQQQPAKKHTVQINFEFGRNKLTENRRSLIVSLKFTLRVASMQVPYTAQAPVQWNRASRISFKRVPVMDLNSVSLFRETPQKSIGHNLSFRYPSVRALYSPAASSTDNLHGPASRNASPSAGKRSLGRRQRHNQAVKSPHGSLRGSLRHMPPSLAMRTAAGSLRKKTSHTNLLAAMAAGTPAAAHPHAAAAPPPRHQSPQPHLYHRRRRSRIPESWMFGQSAVGESPGPSNIEFYQGGNSVRSGMSNVLARSLPPPPQATTGQRVARRAPDSVRSVAPEIKFDTEDVIEEEEHTQYDQSQEYAAAQQRLRGQQQQPQPQQAGRAPNGAGGLQYPPQQQQQQQYMMSAMGPQYAGPQSGGGVPGQFDYAAHQQQHAGIMFQQHHMQQGQQPNMIGGMPGVAADPDNPMTSMGLARSVYTQVRAWNDAGHSSMDQPQGHSDAPAGPDGAHQFPIDYTAESSGASYAHHSSMFDGVVHHHHHHGQFVVHDGQGNAHVMADYGSVASSSGDRGSIVSAQ